MSSADTPDGVRANAAAQQLLHQFGSAVAVADVALPSNVVALWVLFGGGIDPPSAVVVGDDSDVIYPGYLFTLYDQTPVSYGIIISVSPALDSGVTITLSSPPGVEWYVIGDAGPRLVIDMALASAVGEPGVPPPGTAVQVAGSDGTDLRVLKTDSTGALVTSGGAFPAVYGAPGAAAPADALQVAGSDGTDLRALRTDVLGHALTVDQNLANAIAGHGAAEPSDALLIGGTDGTDLYPFNVDNTGTLQTNDVNIAGATGSAGFPTPGEAVLMGATDGTDLRVPRADQSGQQYVIPAAPSELAGDHPTNEIACALGGFAANGVLVAAPGAGKRLRILAAMMVNDTGTSVGLLEDSVSSATFFAGNALAPVAMPFPLTGLALSANAAVNYVLLTGAGTMLAAVWYTTETV